MLMAVAVAAAVTFLLLRRSPLPPDDIAFTPVRPSEIPTTAAIAALPTTGPNLATDRKSVRDSVRELNTAPAPRYKARDPGEWQGMLVDLARQSLCNREDGCGLAMACLTDRCGPCERDGQCARGEVCVLDHCLIAANVACRSRGDCPSEILCQLSGYSSDPRGNRNLFSRCRPSSGGEWQSHSEPPKLVGAPSPPRAPIDSSLLTQELEREFRASGAASP